MASTSFSPWALRVERGLEESQSRDAGDLDRILHGEEDAIGGALLRLEGVQVFAVVGDRIRGDVVTGAAGEDVGQRRLDRAIGAHDGVHLPRRDQERQALEDFIAIDGDVEVVDFKQD